MAPEVLIWLPVPLLRDLWPWESLLSSDALSVNQDEKISPGSDCPFTMIRIIIVYLVGLFYLVNF